MITANDIVTTISLDKRAVIKVGSIVRCRYCGKFDAYHPAKNYPFQVLHKITCIWVLSNAMVLLNGNLTR